MYDEERDCPVMSAGIVQLETGPTDAQLAQQYQHEMRTALDVLCKIMTAANRNKMEVAFQLLPNAFGETTIAMLQIKKVLLT